MVIKASSAAEIRQLVDALGGSDEVGREAAAARLRVIGPRAVERLLAAYDKARTPAAQATILRVLEPMADARCVAPARAALASGHDELAAAGAALLRGLVDAADPRVANDALEGLLAVALDTRAAPGARRTASDALRELPAAIRAGVSDGLSPATEAPSSEAPEDTAASVWAALADGRLPDRPAALREALAAHAAGASLTMLQKLVEGIRSRETGAGTAAAEWLALRGAVHQLLAARGSRVALYDLREALEGSSAPLPVSFLSALHTLGDRSCLEPLAEAYAHAPEHESWWRQQLASAFQAILVREQLTARSAVVKKIVAKWPGIETTGKAALQALPDTPHRR